MCRTLKNNKIGTICQTCQQSPSHTGFQFLTNEMPLLLRVVKYWGIIYRLKVIMVIKNSIWVFCEIHWVFIRITPPCIYTHVTWSPAQLSLDFHPWLLFAECFLMINCVFSLLSCSLCLLHSLTAILFSSLSDLFIQVCRI